MQKYFDCHDTEFLEEILDVPCIICDSNINILYLSKKFNKIISYIQELPDEKSRSESEGPKEHIPEINEQLKLKLNTEEKDTIKKTEITLNGNRFIFSVRKFSGNNKSEGFILRYEPEVEPADCVVHVMKLNKILHTINRIICATSSAENQRDLLPIALRMTVELMNFDAGAIYFPDSNLRSASMDVYYGLYDLFFDSKINLKSENSNYSGVFRDNKAIYTEQYLGVPHEENESGVFSMAIIPVITDEKTIAILSIATSNIHRFSELEKETLEAIGKEIGGFIRLVKLQRELIYANEEANLYLDIMTHDINNANLISQGYLEILEEISADKPEKYVKKALSGVVQSSDIIRNVSVIRRFREDKLKLKKISLDRILTEIIRNYPDANIKYDNCGLTVTADELLPEVFLNLFGNSLKHGGRDTAITVSAKEEEGKVFVNVCDDGTGIPDDKKPDIFRRYYKGRIQSSGKGLGLSIVQMILERYKANITVNDRVAGDYRKGVCFRITFEK
ncbi:GAF domain-containing sensor histidine kinase [Methanoplanus endosymbiosus]|uniref:histidine kinase n=1 Tax=Methanoplanus endosymbiosus TaxID=33865 RepID=A0A9E7PRD9_9EURY|nr:GAF domain-containing sensor histidine kinase [Methanoplanus endosymbiosus]UUX93671.1 GAF domain-containing sensor histidine kinase [Methanoplanus endosymbiosus]